MKNEPLSTVIPTLKLTPTQQHAAIEEAAAVLAETLHIERQFHSSTAGLHKRTWKEVRSQDDIHIYKERRPRPFRRFARSRRSLNGTIGLSGIEESSSVDGSIFMANSESSMSMSTTTSARMRFLGFDSTSLDGTIQFNGLESISEDFRASSAQSTATASSEGVSIVSAMKDPRVPMLVAAGKVEGKLEDIVFGSLNCDEVSWRLRSTYMKDKLADARILSTILGPTEEDPYRFLSVKWFMRERKKSVITPLVYNRDFLVIEATGLTVDEYGVPHGYYLLHTFKHPSLPELTDLKIVRCNISLCYISRQISANRVQIFGRGFVDPGGDLLQGISDALAAEAMLSTANVAETSYAKKLMWLITQERSTNAQQRHQHAQSMAAKRCVACKKHVRFLSGSLSFCQVCGKCVCSKCTIPRKLVVDISTGGITERVLPFCFACVLEAKETSPRQVAIETVVRPQAP